MTYIKEQEIELEKAPDFLEILWDENGIVIETTETHKTNKGNWKTLKEFWEFNNNMGYGKFLNINHPDNPGRVWTITRHEKTKKITDKEFHEVKRKKAKLKNGKIEIPNFNLTEK